MAFAVIPLAALVLLVLTAVYKWLVYPALFSPLAKISNAHWSSPISSLWILNERRNRRETFTVHEAHDRLGPIVRLAPNEISVNSVDGGIRTVYSGGYEKGDWYRNVFNNYGVEPMFSMSGHSPHSKRKRMLSNIYAKSTLQNSSAMSAISCVLMKDRLIPHLRVLSQSGKPIEFYTIFQSVTHDFVSSYVFGLSNGSNLLQDETTSKKYFQGFKARQAFMFWPQELPNFTRCLDKLGLLWAVVPSWAIESNRGVENFILTMCDRAEQTIVESEATGSGNTSKVEDWPNVYVQLRNALLKEKTTKGALDLPIDQLVRTHRLEVASEMLDHTLAGFDTSSITLVFLAWELSRSQNKAWQDKLRLELLGLQDRHDAKEIDNLPILHAILMESLRLHAPIPGNQPRITPAQATLGAPSYSVTDIPEGVRVQAQAWSLHRNPSVFPDPETWNPARWLESSEDQKKEMSRWFWAFGSGGRMCVGSNLAMLDMKAIITAIWAEFKTTVVDDEGMVHNGTYVAEPRGKNGKWLLLKLEEEGAKSADENSYSTGT